LKRKGSGPQYLSQRDKYRKNEVQNLPFKRERGIEKGHALWSLFIFFLSFSLSVLLLLISNSIFERVSAVQSFIVVIFIILTGVLFDMVGMAVTAAEETPFHSMASRKIRGARQSIMLIRNAPRVSSICNDVIGDICSVVSGTAGAAIIYRVFSHVTDTTWFEILMGAMIAALTVGGKALGKNIGLQNSNYIIYHVGRLFSFFQKNKGKPSSKIEKKL
jgi:hypothetical protein